MSNDKLRGFQRLGPLALGAALAVAAFAGVPRPASAYVRYRTTTANACPYFWKSRSLNIDAYPRDLSDISVDASTAAILQAVDAWTKRDIALAGCTDLDLKVTVKGDTAVVPTARYDHHNIVAFRTDNWCAPKDDGTPDAACTMPHEPSALAITSVFAHKVYGEILDADVEVNGINFIWGDLVTMPDATKQDLQNALTHEMGHFIGLDHTCTLGGLGGAAPKDQNGDPVPTCAAASPEIRATTMFASAEPGDISKRTLEADDQAAVCAIYPAGAADPEICKAPDDGGCSVAPTAEHPGSRFSPATWILGVAGAAVASALFWRRSRRRRPR